MEGENIDKFGECLAIRQTFIRQLFKSLIEMAGLLKYFKRERHCDTPKKEAEIRTYILPDPNGPLSKDVSSSSIEITNAHVQQVQQKVSSKKSARGPYLSLTPAQRFSIGKRAAKNGVTATLRYYSRTFPDLSPKLKEATVRRYKDNYLLRMNSSGCQIDLQELLYKNVEGLS